MHKLQIARKKLQKMAIFIRCEATYLIFKFKLIILQDQIYNDFVGNVMNVVHEIFKTMFNGNRNFSQHGNKNFHR